jgi:predicted RND superfamily exporter protein
MDGADPAVMERIDWIDPGAFAAVAALLALSVALGMLRPAWIVRHALVVLAAVAGISIVAAAALVSLSPPRLHLQVDPSTEPLLPKGDPARLLYGDAVRNFGDDEVFVVAMETDDVFRPERLRQLEAVTDAIAHLAGVRRAQSLMDVISFRYDPEQDWVEVSSFIDDVPDDPAELAELRRRALADPLYEGNLISADGRTAAINVSFRKMSDREFIASGIDESISEILSRQAGDGVRFYVAGRPHVKVTVYHWMLRDLVRLVPLALLAMAGVLAGVFGSVRGVVVPLATVLVANLWTFAAMAFLERPLTILTTLLAPTLIAVGSIYGVHMVARFEEEAPHSSTSAETARRCLMALRLPVLVAGLTTVIGFAALLVSDVPAVAELGTFAAFGIASVTALTLTAAPALLALFPFRPTAPQRLALSARLALWLDDRLERLGHVVTSRRRLFLLGFAAIAAVAAAYVPRIVIDTDYLSFFDAEAPVRLEFEAVNRLLSGAVPIYVSMQADEPGGFREPAVLQALEALQSRADRIPDVSRTESVVDTLRILNRTLADDDPAQERIPDSRGAVSELLFLAPKGHLDRFTNVNHSRANLLVRTGAVGTASVTRLASRLEQLLADGALPGNIEAGVTGNAILLARSADGIARSQPQSVGLATLAILGLIALSLRSLRLGLVAMLPNVWPVLVYFGLLGIGVAPLSLPTSLIGSVALGLAIDDTVHILVRYQRERRAGLDANAATRMAMRRVGRPVSITSAMLCAGFGVVALSGFASLREFGILSAVTMALCLAADLLLLPALLAQPTSPSEGSLSG